MSNQPGRLDELESVEIIASGYEWTCPSCEQFH